MAPKQLQLDAVLGALRAFHLQHGSWPKRKDARAGGDALARKVSVATKTWAGMSAPEKQRLRGNFAAEVQWLLREIPLGAGGHDPASGCRGRLRDVLRGLQVFHGEHGSWPKRGDPRRGADTLARKVGGLRNLWQQVSEEDRAELRAEFADEVAWLLGEDRPDVVCATLREGMDFHAKHGRHARRGRAGQVHKEDALAQRVGRAVRVARHREELRQQFGDFLESWTDADAALDAALEASRSALEEGVAFREQHARFPLRGREAKLEGEDSLARRIARAALVAQQHEELRQQFGDFLESWTDADAALDATLEASRSALEEGVAFREQHARFPLRGREAKLEGEDSLAQRIARALLVAQQHEELRQQFGDFLESWTDADAALEASRSALEEGVAFREQHARFPRRGREAKLEGEDSLAQRIARAVLVAQQHEELRQQFGDFSSSPGRTRMLRWKLRGLLWRKEWPSVSSTLVSLVVAVKQNSRGKTLWRDVSPERCLLRSSMRSCGSSLATSSSPGRTQMLRWKLRCKLPGLLWRKEWPSVSSMADTRVVVANQSWRRKMLLHSVFNAAFAWHSRRNPLRWNSLISYHPGRMRLSHQRAPWRTCSEAEPCWKSWNLFPVACFAHIDIMLGM